MSRSTIHIQGPPKGFPAGLLTKLCKGLSDAFPSAALEPSRPGFMVVSFDDADWEGE